MKCSDFERYAGAYLAGTLTGDIRQLMDDHGKNCPACAESLRIQESIGRCLSDAPQMSAPEGLADLILDLAAKTSPESDYSFVPEFLESPAPTDFGCREFGINVAAFVEGNLADNINETMKEHMKTCHACTNLAIANRAVLAALVSSEEIKAPRELTAQILALVEEEELEKASSSLWKRLLLYVSGAAALGSAISVINGLINKTLTRIPSVTTIETGMSPFKLRAIAYVNGLKETTLAPAFTYVSNAVHFLVTPFELPYVSYAVPPYYALALAVFATITWYYFDESRNPIVSDFIR